MRAITRPNFNFSEIYDACANSIEDPFLRGRITSVKPTVVSAAVEYEQKANVSRLFEIPSNNQQNDEVVTGLVTKKEFKDLYSQHMVGQRKPARATYDQLLALAPLGKCPFCTIGDASTLDHYLPKDKFPLASIFPLNLVPSCKDCNTGKRAGFAVTIEEQSLHPYFDDLKFISNQWLYASVVETSPAIVRFYAAPPAIWDDISKQRIITHFESFKLASRFSKQAANELPVLSHLLNPHYSASGVLGVRGELLHRANSYANVHVNSWQTAMYQALAASTWYCDGGFN